MPTPFHYLLSKYQNQRKQTTKTSSAKNHPIPANQPAGKEMQQRVQERKQTHKKSHTSPSLCSPLFFFSHHRILKHSKTKNASKFLETKSKIKARKKERKTQTQNTNKQGIAKTYETSRDSVLEIWRCRRRYDADAEVTNRMEELWRAGEGKFSKHESKKKASTTKER